MNRKIPSDAFEMYVALGASRSYETLASRLGVSKRSITKIAAREDWAARLETIELEARKRSDAKAVESIEEIRTRHLKMLKAMAARAIAGLQGYPLTSGMEAMRAAEMVIKLERLVCGEATERTVEEIVRRESERWLTEDAELEHADRVD